MKVYITSTQGGMSTCAMTYTAPNGQTYRTVVLANTHVEALKQAIERIDSAIISDTIPF